MEGKGTPQMIHRGELESMSKKIKEKRNNLWKDGMQSLGGLTPDLCVCVEVYTKDWVLIQALKAFFVSSLE